MLGDSQLFTPSIQSGKLYSPLFKDFYNVNPSIIPTITRGVFKFD